MLSVLILSVLLLDFETPEEIAAVPVSANGSRTVAVESGYATHGTKALRFACRPWRAGWDEWPSFTIKSPIADWRPYDRLVIDLVNTGDHDDGLSLYVSEAEGRVQNGFLFSTRVPVRGYARWTVKLAGWPGSVDPAKIGRLHFFTSRPRGFDVRIDRLTLLKKGEALPAPDGPDVGGRILPMISDGMAALTRERDRARAERERLESYWRFREKCAAAGQDTKTMLVGLASSMSRVRPRAGFSAEAARSASVRLAHGEYESVQVIVAPGDEDLKDVAVAVEGDLKGPRGATFPASQIGCAVVGYVEITNAPPYSVGHTERDDKAPGYHRKAGPVAFGWYPDPILDYLQKTDVSGLDAQGFWVRVKCPEEQKTGVYTGALVVSAKGVAPRTIPLTVRVNAFSMPKISPLALAITFDPGVKDLKAGTAREIWRQKRLEWGDFLADYFVTMDSLYWNDPAWDVLVELKKQGRLGLFNLGYWPENSVNAAKHLKANWLKAKELGLAEKAYLYGCDEIRSDVFPLVSNSVDILKKEMPGVPVFTTTSDPNYGVGTILAKVDWFCPLTTRYVPEKAAAARREGRQVWWYICCGPHAPQANGFVEGQPIELRMLMGAQSVQYRPDGFLYFQTSLWGNNRPITCGPFTSWDPTTWETYHGDGGWTCCGPGGCPLATLRLENFRDGIEDYAYAMELERLLKGNPGDVAWTEKAKALLAVPKSVSESLGNFTDDPQRLLEWRNGMADLIEERMGKGGK